MWAGAHEGDNRLLKPIAELVIGDADVHLAGEAGNEEERLKEIAGRVLRVHRDGTRMRLGPAAATKSRTGWLPLEESECRKVAAEPTMISWH